jgi:small neutral amino acid transporter SnatA (MarC family)
VILHTSANTRHEKSKHHPELFPLSIFFNFGPTNITTLIEYLEYVRTQFQPLAASTAIGL